MTTDYYFSETVPTNNYPTHKQFNQLGLRDSDSKDLTIVNLELRIPLNI